MAILDELTLTATDGLLRDARSDLEEEIRRLMSLDPLELWVSLHSEPGEIIPVHAYPPVFEAPQLWVPRSYTDFIDEARERDRGGVFTERINEIEAKSVGGQKVITDDLDRLFADIDALIEENRYE